MEDLVGLSLKMLISLPTDNSPTMTIRTHETQLTITKKCLSDDLKEIVYIIDNLTEFVAIIRERNITEDDIKPHLVGHVWSVEIANGNSKFT